MADKKSTAMSEEAIEKKMMSFNSSQDSVQGLSLWIMQNKAHHQKIVDTWLKVLRKCEVKHKLTLFYLCNDVVQHAKKKKALYYLENFKDNLREAVKVVREYESIKPNIGRIFKIWEERKVYDIKFIKELKLVLDGESSSKSSSASGTPALSPPVTYKPSEKASEKPSKKDKPFSKPVERDKPISRKEDEKEMAEDIESDVLGEFKTSTFVEKMSSLKQQEVEVALKAKHLASLRIDATNIEAVKQLKDRSHGKEFCRQFEESCVKIEDYVEILEKEIKQRQVVLSLCDEAELFFDEQFKEAKIVATAYKNFGARVTNMKKRVDDMKKIIPATPSPVPSPTVDVPSPGNSPGMLEMDDNETVDMDICNDDVEASKGQDNGILKPGSAYTAMVKSISHPIASLTNIVIGQKDASSKTVSVVNQEETVDTFQGGNILEARIANMLPNLAKGSSSIVSQAPPPPASVAVNIPSTLVSQATPPSPAISTIEPQEKESAQPDLDQEMYDPSRADNFLDVDNGSSTPVQDEQDDLEEKQILPSSPPQKVMPLKVSPPRQASPLWNASPPRQVSPHWRSSPPHKASPVRRNSPRRNSPSRRNTPTRKVSPLQRDSPPRRTTPPPKPAETKVKTNPIDFLSQLLTKTNNSSSSSNFLQTLSLLTNTVKTQYQKRQEIGEIPKKEEIVRAPAGLLLSQGSFSGVPLPPQPTHTASWSSWKSGNDPSQPPIQQQHTDPSPPMMQQSNAMPFPPRPPLPSHPPPPELMRPMQPLSPDFSVPPPIGPPPISQTFINPPSIPPPPIANQFSLPTSSTVFPQISNSQTLPSHSAASVSVSPVTLGPRYPGTGYNPSFPFGLISPPVSESMLAPAIPQLQSTSPVTSPVFFPSNVTNWNTLRTESQPVLHSQAPNMLAGFSLGPPPPPPDSVAPPPWPQDPSMNPNGFVSDRYGDNKISSHSSHRGNWEPMNPNYENNNWKQEHNSESLSSGYAHRWDQPQDYEDEEVNDYDKQQPAHHPIPPPPQKSILRNIRTSSLREVTLVDESESDGSDQNYMTQSENLGRPMGIFKKLSTDLNQVNSAIDAQSEMIAKLKQKSGAGAAMCAPCPAGWTLTAVPTQDTASSESMHSSNSPFKEHGGLISTIGVLGNNGCSARSEDMEINNKEMEYSSDVNVPAGDSWSDGRELETKRWKSDDGNDFEHEHDVGGPLQRPRWPLPEPPRQWHHRIPGPNGYWPRSFEPRPYFVERFRGPSSGNRPFFSPRQRLPYYRH